MDVFLGGEFSTYGMDVVQMTELDPDNRIDPMSKVFPKVNYTIPSLSDPFTA